MKNLVCLFAFQSIANAAHAVAFLYHASLSGPNEDPPEASPGIGTALVTIDTEAHILRVTTSFSDLIGTVMVAHIHAPTAVPFAGIVGVATPTPTFPGFSSGVTSGSYDETSDLTLASSFNAAFVTANGGTPEGAEAALAAAFKSWPKRRRFRAAGGAGRFNRSLASVDVKSLPNCSFRG